MISNFRVALLGSLVGAVSAHNYSNTTEAIEYTTEIVTQLTTYCPAATTLTHGTNTYTVTEATTLTITDCPCTITKPVKPTTTPEVVYTTEVVTELTTYCPEATTLTHGNKTYTVTEPTTLTITDCPCTISKPIPTHSVPTSPADCPSECSAKFDTCRSKPQANMATCSAEYAACLGYNPWSNGTFITPSACSHQPGKPSVTLPVSIPTHPPSAPGSSGPVPVPSAPTGIETVPVSPSATGPQTVPTGGAGQLAPFGVAAAVAVMALL